jgi:hypothetical protein
MSSAPGWYPATPHQIIINPSARDILHTRLVIEKLDSLVVPSEVDVADALGEDEAEPLLELVDVPIAALSRATR